MAGETRIQVRRDTAAAWSATNPILADGEFGLDRTSRKMKLGDGVTAWNTLGFLNNTVYLEQLFVDGAAEGSGIYVQDSEYVPAIPKVGGPTVDYGIAGWSAPRVLYGTEVQFPAAVPTGTLVYVSDYPDGSRLRYMKPGGTSVGESEPILTPYSGVSVGKLITIGASAGQTPVFNGTIVTWGNPTVISGGAVVGSWAHAKAPYGSLAEWEIAVPGFVMPAGALWWVGDVLMCSPPSYGSGFDDSPVVYTAANPPEFAALNGTLAYSQLPTAGATSGQVLKFNGTSAVWGAAPSGAPQATLSTFFA